MSDIWILSRQQRRVLQLAACGFTNGQIAKMTALSESAVRGSLTQARIKLDARCKIDAVFAGIYLGEISELHAYQYVEARQVANYLSSNNPLWPNALSRKCSGKFCECLQSG
jgi:DNA-binding CsgD family transcriptional regulator